MVGNRIHLLELLHVNIAKARHFPFCLGLLALGGDIGLGRELGRPCALSLVDAHHVTNKKDIPNKARLPAPGVPDRVASFNRLRELGLKAVSSCFGPFNTEYGDLN